ncbi:hypothetical protein PMAYCL1PPCAC_22771, partial [Pristionchus mayeri]
KVFCSGSPQFLRKKFDSGFVLSFTVNNEADTETSSNEVISIIKQFVPDVHLVKNKGHQFELKLNSDESENFPEMFRRIEEDGPNFGLQSYGLSLNRLEQVFLKVGEMTGTVDRSEEVAAALKELINENEKRLCSPMKIAKQFVYILRKRLIFDLAHIPSLVIMLAMIFAITSSLFRGAIAMGPSQDEGTSDAVDYLSIAERYRIGVDPSVWEKKTNIERISKRFGGHLSIVRTSEDANKWYYANARSRPPILGIISRNGQNWTITVPSNHEVYLPTLESIVAMLNNPKLENIQFKVREVERARVKRETRQERSTREEATVKEINGKQTFTLITFPFLLSLVTPLMVIRPISFLIIERVSHFGHQQRLTGVSRVVFLSSSIFYDFLLFLLNFVAFLIACFTAESTAAVNMASPLIYLPFLAFLSGELIILLFYRLFATPAKGFVLTLLLLMGAGLVSLISTFALNWIDLRMQSNTAETSLHHLLSPMLAAFMWGVSSERDKLAEISARYRGLPQSTWHVTGPIFILLHFIALIGSFLLIELRMWTPLWSLCNRSTNKTTSATNYGVEDSVVLRVKNLQKWYGKGETLKKVVNGITFGVHAHECFGVLGINGAGKTSTFEMFTGNTLPSGGSATVGGVDCSKAPTIGYCPQADALVEDLTGRQSLVILAALHGYENPRKVANIVIICVGMQDHADKKTGTYSGGQRRKISVAASLLAQNSLIILDEPTAGIDPIARRDIWSVICALRKSTNTVIVLTSHSMDEVEALVSNLIIIRDGTIVVEGSPQMIKSKFGGHYNFALVIENISNLEEVTSQVDAVFPTASLYDSASLRNIKFRIPRFPSDVFSSLFEKASTIAQQLNASHFSFTQATLEDAFMLAATPTVSTGAMVPNEMQLLL